MEKQQAAAQSAYRKRSVGQWVVFCVVIGGILYTIIYFAFLHKQNPYLYSKPQANSVRQTQQVNNGVYKMMSKDKLGIVMADPKGMTLYIYTKDAAEMSNCTGQCLTNWPAYIAPSQTGNLPKNISVITQLDGTLQYAWKGMPLYYFAKDGDSGDAYGNGIGSVWSVIK